MNTIYWRLCPNRKKEIDKIRLIEIMARNEPIALGDYFEITEIDCNIESFRQEIVNRIVEKGFTNFLSPLYITDSLIRKGESSKNIATLMSLFLSKMDIKGELIIVDSYLFECKENKGINLFRKISNKFFGNLNKLVIVTSESKSIKGNNSEFADYLNGEFKTKYHNIEIEVKFSNSFHDRFWISSQRTKGILMGASLNGLKSKYSLIDKLGECDVKEIVDSLIMENLL